MNRFRFRTAIAVCLAMLFLILPLFSLFANAAVGIDNLNCSPTSAYDDEASVFVSYSKSELPILLNSGSGFEYYDGNYISKRVGGRASFYWIQNSTIYITSSQSFTVELGGTNYDYEPFTYCVLTLLFSPFSNSVVIDGITISCATFTITSSSHTVVTNTINRVRLLTEHGRPIAAEDYQCVLYSMQDVRIENDCIIVNTVGQCSAYLLTKKGLIIVAEIYNSPYCYTNIEVDSLTYVLTIEFERYTLVQADKEIIIANTGVITFGDSGNYVIEFIRGEYITVISFTVTKPNADIDNDKDNGNNSETGDSDSSSDEAINPDDETDGDKVDTDEENGGNDEIIDGGNGEVDSSTNTDYDFNISREFDLVKIGITVAFVVIVLLGIACVIVFVVVRKKKRNKNL